MFEFVITFVCTRCCDFEFLFQFVFVIIIFSPISRIFVAAINKTDRSDNLMYDSSRIRIHWRRNMDPYMEFVFSPDDSKILFLEMFFIIQNSSIRHRLLPFYSHSSAKSLILIVSPSSGKSQTKWLTIAVGITFLS